MTDPNTAKSSGSSADPRQMRDELAEDASRLKDAATHRAEQEIDSGKHKAMSAVQSTASALEKAAGTIRDEDSAPEWLSSAMEKSARHISGLAGKIDNQEVADIRHDVADFARQNPGAFLAASAAAGFMAARFLRAGGEYQAHHKGDRARQASGAETPDTDFSRGRAGAESYAPGNGGSARQAGSRMQNRQGETS